MTDPIADMLNRIHNAQAVGHTIADIPLSRIKLSLAEILEKEGFIKSIEKKGRGAKRRIELELIYEDKKNTKPRISKIQRISRPGQRQYIKAQEIRLVLGGRGINIISTSKGLMTGKEARKRKLGGELLCEIW